MHQIQKTMLRLFQCKMISVVKYFRRNHFSEKNDFLENIFRRLTRTKKLPMAKNEI
jgi:hypothetical protein